MRKNHKNLLILLPLLMLIILGIMGGRQPIKAAACDVAGLIQNDTTWSPGSCDPYIVTGNIIVNENTTLTINPGTNIQFNSGTELTVRGALVARGVSGNLITFTSNQTSKADGDWTGILFENTSVDATLSGLNYVSGSIIQYAIIEYADNGIDLAYAYPLIDNNIIRFNNRGIYMSRSLGDNDSTVTITNNSIVDNGWNTDGSITSGGGIYSYRVQLRINNNTISRNRATQSGGGIYFSAGYGDVNIIDGNRIENNEIAVYYYNYGGGGIYARYGSIELIDNLIQNNTVNGTGGGVAFAGAAPRDIRDNIVRNNSAEHGGGFFFDIVSAGYSAVQVIDNTITDNVATIAGGGVFTALPGTDDVFTFAYNDIYDNTLNGQPNDFTTGDALSFSEDIIAVNNWWGTTNKTTIENRITHAVDDADLGLVIFEPFCTAACDAPITYQIFLPVTIR